MADIGVLRGRLMKQLARAETKHDIRAVVLVVKEIAQVSEIIGRLSGQLRPDGTLVQVAIQVGAGSGDAVREWILQKLTLLAGE